MDCGVCSERESAELSTWVVQCERLLKIDVAQHAYSFHCPILAFVQALQDRAGAYCRLLGNRTVPDALLHVSIV